MTLLKCLSIGAELLTEPRFNKLGPSLLAIMENLVCIIITILMHYFKMIV